MLRSSFSHICFSSEAPGLDWQNLLKPAHSELWVELLILPIAGGHVATFSGGLGGPGSAGVVGGSDWVAAARAGAGGGGIKAAATGCGGGTDGAPSFVVAAGSVGAGRGALVGLVDGSRVAGVAASRGTSTFDPPTFCRAAIKLLRRREAEARGQSIDVARLAIQLGLGFLKAIALALRLGVITLTVNHGSLRRERGHSCSKGGSRVGCQCVC